MTTPYTYLIGWSKLNKWYYGRRTAKNCHPNDFWVKYFTSSKYVKQFRKDHGEPDIIQIRKTFKTIEECCKWETKFLKKVDASHNKNFLNCSNGDEHWHTHNSKVVGKYIRTKSIREKQSSSATGKAKAYDPITKEFIGKISVSDIRWKTGEIIGLSHLWSEEQKKKQSKLLLGKPKSKEHGEKISLTTKGVPKNRVCRICDRKEMSVCNFTRSIRGL